MKRRSPSPADGLLTLEEIRRALDDPKFDAKQALLEQRRQLQRRARDTEAMLHAVDHALALLDSPSTQKDHAMNPSRLFQGFHPTRYEEEAKQRWGHTDAYRESKARAERYTAQDWLTIKEEQAAIYRDAHAALEAGSTPDDPDVRSIAERHRLSIDRWFYPCSHSMHVGLADLYESDARFAQNIDHFGAGLTPFLAAAIRANTRSATDHDDAGDS